MILFGGGEESLAGYAGGTWEWDGISWMARRPGSEPSARTYYAMVYDRARSESVMFGGWSNSGTLSETWAWNGVTWSKQSPLASPSRRVTAMAYDSVRNRVVLFGGSDGSSATPLGDTWEWDGVNWSDRRPAIAPPVRYASAMVYDAARKRVVLFGGSSPSGQLGDTWEWDGMAWVQRFPAVSPPATREHQMAYDSVRQRVVLFGGWGPAGFTGTWEWDGTNWIQRNQTPEPTPRTGHAMTYDSVRGCTVLYGGGDLKVGGLLSDRWEYDGIAWVRRDSGVPPSRGGHGLATDLIRNRVVLFGGEYGLPKNDTWEWDGSAWQAMSSTTSPPGRRKHAMAYDVARKLVVLHGGDDGTSLLSDTWEWDGANWHKRTPATTSPQPLATHGMAYDLHRQRTVVFGSTGPASPTWEWDGNDWTLHQGLVPPARLECPLAYDPVRRRIVLFGGAHTPLTGRPTYYGDTWEWDGTTWVERRPMNAPLPRAGHLMTYDWERQRIVLFGGYNDVQGSMPETWEWDGSDWTQIPITGGPQYGSGVAMAYDPMRRAVFGFWGPPVWIYGHLTPAAATPFGNGCPGTNGIPITTSGTPHLGNPGFALDLVSARGSSPFAFALSAAKQSLQLGNCTLYVKDPVFLLPGTTNTAGFGTFALPLPLDLSLRGMTAYAQGFVADPLGAHYGLSLTGGLQILLGDH